MAKVYVHAWWQKAYQNKTWNLSATHTNHIPHTHTLLLEWVKHRFRFRFVWNGLSLREFVNGRNCVEYSRQIYQNDSLCKSSSKKIMWHKWNQASVMTHTHTQYRANASPNTYNSINSLKNGFSVYCQTDTLFDVYVIHKCMFCLDYRLFCCHFVIKWKKRKLYEFPFIFVLQ